MYVSQLTESQGFTEMPTRKAKFPNNPPVRPPVAHFDGAYMRV